MIVTLKWLNDFVDLSDLSPEAIAEKFINIGFEVEEMRNLSKGMERVKVGRIRKLSRHPNADKLQVCDIDLGNGESVQILTAATNVFEGALVPAALDGADLPNGVKIKTTNMRGLESQGMLCSGEELCIDNSVYPNALVDGIMILDESATLGEPIAEFLGLDDVIFDIKVLANRPDCQSVYGLAKELAASLNRTLKEPNFAYTTQNVDLPISVSVETDNCPLYLGCVIKNLKLAPSPKYMQNRLKAVGITPRNNIVDFTNCVLFELGQPLHAFDYDKIKNHHIIVRQAKKGEKVECLDGKEYALNDSIMVIADEEQPIGLAGIMGGKHFSISEDTKNVFIESAIFDRVCIRRGSRSLGIRTDASGRYERGVEKISAINGLKRILSLIDEFKIGEISQNVIKIGDYTEKKRVVELKFDEIEKTLGLKIDYADVGKILSKLDITTTLKGDMLVCTIPEIRADIELPADIIEEIIRYYGFEKIVPTHCENTESTAGGMSELFTLEHNLTNYMMATGAHQVKTYGFRSPLEFDRLILPQNSPLRNCVKIENPLSLDYSIMRTEIIGSLLDVAKLNVSRKNKDIEIFEIGKVFENRRDEKDNLPIESKVLAYLTLNKVDFFYVKSITEMLSSKLGVNFTYRPVTCEFLHPNISASINIGNKCIGLIGKVHPQVAKNYEINADCYYFELYLNAIPPKKFKKVKPLPKFPAAHRDLAVVVKKDVAVGEMIDAIKRAVNNILEDVELFDVYEGEQVATNCKSVAFNITFRKTDNTLTQEEINDAFDKILSKLESTFNAKLRV